MSNPKYLLKYLNQQEGFVPARVIAKELGLSIRTVQNYLREIKETYPDLLITSQKGVKARYKVEIDGCSNSFDDYEKRKTYIIREILINHQEPSMYELSEQFCISYSTLENEIKKIKRDLAKHSLRLRSKNDYLYIDGAVKDKKELITGMIYNESENSLVSYDQLDKIFVGFDSRYVRDTILNELNSNNYFVDEFSLMNLVLHILISMENAGGGIKMILPNFLMM